MQTRTSVLCALAMTGTLPSATSQTVLMTSLRSSVVIEVRSPPEPAARNTELPMRAPLSMSHCTFFCSPATSTLPSSANGVISGITTPCHLLLSSSTLYMSPPDDGGYCPGLMPRGCRGNRLSARRRHRACRCMVVMTVIEIGCVALACAWTRSPLLNVPVRPRQLSPRGERSPRAPSLGGIRPPAR